MAVAGGVPGGVPGRLDIPLRPDQRADAAAVQVLGKLVLAIEANLPGTLADTDSEFLHDLRVAVRRTRALQRELKGVFERESLEHFRDGFRWLQAVTGPTRDLDVYLLDFDRFRAALPRTWRATSIRSRRCWPRSAGARSGGWRARCARRRPPASSPTGPCSWRAWSSRPRTSGPTPAAPIGELAADRIGKVYRRMVKRGRAIDESAPPEALHELRKQGKELRYLLEFFASLYPPEVVRPMVKTLKALQDTLGRFQDAEVQAAMLHTYRESVGSRERGAAALMAMGLLVDRLEQDRAEARARFAERFDAFAVAAPARARGGDVRVTRVLATYNIKGGVGKTSAAVNLAYLAARENAHVLLWDLDPQGASTYLFRVKPKVKGGGRKLVRGKSEVEGLIKGTDHDRLDLLPADFSYRHMDLALDATKKPDAAAVARCSRRSPASTTTSSSTARRASRWCRRACSRRPTRCSCR